MNKLIIAVLAGILISCNTGGNESSKKPGAPVINDAIIKEFVEHYDNGIVKIRGSEKDDKRIGKWESFYPNGYKWSETNYRDGYRQGEIIVYYDNGIMRYEGHYSQDERSGIWNFFDSTGVRIVKLDMDEIHAVPDSLFR